MSLEENIFMARVAEQAERFDDMVHYLQEVVVNKNEDFTTEERNLLSVGFKNQIGSKRTELEPSALLSKTQNTQSLEMVSLPTRRRLRRNSTTNA